MKTQTEERTRVPKPKDFVPVEFFVEGHERAGRRQCQAWNPNEGRQCENYPLKGVTKCRSHGGRGQRGRANPNYKHGRYTLPNALEDAYFSARSDPDLLSLRDEIAVLRVRANELLEALDIEQTASAWNDLQNASRRLRNALRDQDAPGIIEASNDIQKIVSRGAEYSQKWEEIAFIFEQIRKQSESERKRARDLYQILTIEQVMGLLANVVEIVRSNVKDEKSRRVIASEIRELIS